MPTEEEIQQQREEQEAAEAAAREKGNEHVPSDHPETDMINVPDDGAITFGAAEDEGKAAEEEAARKAQEEKAKADREQQQERQQPKRNKKEFQTRIGELTRKAHDAREDAAAARARADLLEEENRQLKAEREARQDRRQEQQGDADEKALLEKKAKALQDADLVLYDQVRDELDALKAKKAADAQRREREAESTEARRKEQQQGRQQQRGDDEIDPSARAWMDANEWFNKKENKHLQSEAVRIERQLRKDENLPIGKKLYERLDEELRKLPDFDEVLNVEFEDEEAADAERQRQEDLKKRQKEQEQRKPGPQQRRQVNAPPTDTDPPPQQNKPGQLTEWDKGVMRRYGLDANDPKVRAVYLRNKTK